MIKNTAAPTCLALALSLLAAGPALAFEPQALAAAPRLLAGWTHADGSRTAALRLEMNAGWHTYWRRPGDTGIPPQFDWSASHNLAAVQIHWPNPQIFDTSGSATLGYEGTLVLPITLTPRDPAAPIDLSVALDLGVCDEVCLPLSSQVSARFDPSTTGDVPAIQTALAQGPTPAHGATCTATPIADGLRLTATLETPRLGRREVMVIEPSDPAIWVSQAEVLRDGAVIRATSDLVPPNAQPFALERSKVTISVIGDAGAVQTVGCSAP
ncbi:hypothetical protein AQS8620_00591 [Aquimixticola soesokkakensis]|uniref:Thiol:disulfide interchange protein DsbD N-terminal domain-containing protein n=1 Tax=Aquimixticola soesokkakensis TaxID=1519096 RepID=A0A1Y5RRS5_9RHOB|nr:protein-disulfide reductase DsbD domain-containing protein [Aquimixticola soesokkakensis]SLN21197.1 hypothetical protein AQS8620_00591 [Aquimixticola soesokkakensis]